MFVGASKSGKTSLLANLIEYGSGISKAPNKQNDNEYSKRFKVFSVLTDVLGETSKTLSEAHIGWDVITHKDSAMLLSLSNTANQHRSIPWQRHCCLLAEIDDVSTP